MNSDNISNSRKCRHLFFPRSKEGDGDAAVVRVAHVPRDFEIDGRVNDLDHLPVECLFGVGTRRIYNYSIQVVQLGVL